MSDAYKPVIGLEIHCQLNTKTKLFCADPYSYGASSNTQVGPVTLALPGVLPVLNKEVLQLAIRAGLALNCKIAEVTKFDRKHYFYPDLPKGYQISQYDQPYAIGGQLTFRRKNQSKVTVKIERIHMEEDAGKLIHSSSSALPCSYIDLNRAGVPLLEIVTEPDLYSAEDASEFLHTLRTLLRSINVTDGNMEEGSLRCDANVSVRKGEDFPLGTRVEIKNLNSFKAIRSAILYEIERQSDVLEDGGSIIQSTVLWNADEKKTTLMRTKENAEDYRYFPDPDLLPFSIPTSLVEEIQANMPELPEKRRMRYIQELQLSEYDADVLGRDNDIADYFERVFEICDDAKKASNWVKDEMLGILNKKQISINDFACTADRLGRIICLLNDGKITSPLAKQVFEHVYTENKEPEEIIKKHNYKPVDVGDLNAIVCTVFEENQSSVQKILNGNDRVKGHLVGQVMKKTLGQAPPQEVNHLIEKKLKSLPK